MTTIHEIIDLLDEQAAQEIEDQSGYHDLDHCLTAAQVDGLLRPAAIPPAHGYVISTSWPLEGDINLADLRDTSGAPTYTDTEIAGIRGVVAMLPLGHAGIQGVEIYDALVSRHRHVVRVLADGGEHLAVYPSEADLSRAIDGLVTRALQGTRGGE